MFGSKTIDGPFKEFGKFFFQFGVTISVTVLLSLVEALTITPMRCSRFVTTHKRTDFIGRNFEALMDKSRIAYTRTLEICLRHPWKVIFVATLTRSGRFSTMERTSSLRASRICSAL